MEVAVWKLGSFQLIGLACFGVVIGIWLKKWIPVLDRLNIPACIVGGMVYAVLTLGLRDRYLNLEMDAVLRDILMVLFFTTIGMSASLRVAAQGGRQVMLFFGVATIGLTFQNLLGVAVAMAVGLDPLIGLIAGSVALAGGPATAIAFGSTFEGLGISAATTLGIASAIFGITTGGLLSGFLSAWWVATCTTASAPQQSC